METWQGVEGNSARQTGRANEPIEEASVEILKTQRGKGGGVLACFLGWSHCCWKPGPEGAVQVMFKGCPALTFSSLAFTSTSKFLISTGAAEGPPQSRYQHHPPTGPETTRSAWAHIMEGWLNRSSLLTHTYTSTKNRRVKSSPPVIMT